MQNGWIKIHRQITEWEWYSDTPTRSVFFDILIHASHNDYRWKGILIKRGQVIFGRKKISKRLGISEQSIRTAIKHLKSTNEITIQSTNRFSIVTVNNYTKFQTNDEVINQQTNQQTNIQSTINQPSTNHNQEYKELKNIRKTSKEVDEAFKNFWEKYPNKKAKHAAVKSFSRLTEVERTRVQEVLPNHCKQEQWTKDNGRFIPLASTWLNGKRFEDELKVSRVGRNMDWEEGMEEKSIRI